MMNLFKRILTRIKCRKHPMIVKRITHEGCFAEYFGRGGEW